jgi:hypothetical protein
MSEDEIPVVEPDPSAAVEQAPALPEEDTEPLRGIRRVEEFHFAAVPMLRPDAIEAGKHKEPPPKANVKLSVNPVGPKPPRATMRTLSDLEPGRAPPPFAKPRRRP